MRPIPEYKGMPPEAVRAFQAQRTTANRRGIPFLFTFTEWWNWWQIDNRWSNRGMGKDKFVMARRGDVGPYSPENVYCATHSQNHKDVDRNVFSQKTKAAWARGVDFNLRGAANPRSRAIQTPDGRFANARLAAEHYGIQRSAAYYRAKSGKDGWGWAAE